jgi:sec-independent protein translocase protein TatB
MFPEGRIVEFLLAGAVALIVVGPKDLPILMRRLGQFIARMRAMAAEFRASFDELARQSELDELRREVAALRSGATFSQAGALGPDVVGQEVFDDINRSLHEPLAPNVEMTPLNVGPVAEEAPKPSAQSTESSRPSDAPVA